jgi:hypothetical protein
MCCTAYRIYALPKLGWFKCDEEQLQWVTVASMRCLTLRFKSVGEVPPAWLGPERKQLYLGTLPQCTKLEWAVPRAELEAALGKECDGRALRPVTWL